MEQLAWSDGTKPIRSKKEDKTKYATENQEQQEERNSIEQTCILREPSSKREDANEKINEREMIGQTCQNPFYKYELCRGLRRSTKLSHTSKFASRKYLINTLIIV